MESRNVTLTLNKAKEFYNSNNSALKEIALQAFSKDELATPEWEKIKTFKDACNALGIYDVSVSSYLGGTCDTSYHRHVEAINKLNIIRKALNGDWKPNFTEHIIYYPYIRFYHFGKDTKEVLSQNDNLISGKSFISDNKKYTIVCGSYDYYIGGLSQWGCNHGVINPFLGLMACKSKEIAKHMSRYFAKEIFEATYTYYVGLYKWI